MTANPRARAVLDAIDAEEPNLEPGEECGYCDDGLEVLEGVKVQVCVACRPLAYCEWRAQGWPTLPTPEARHG